MGGDDYALLADRMEALLALRESREKAKQSPQQKTTE